MLVSTYNFPNSHKVLIRQFAEFSISVIFSENLHSYVHIFLLLIMFLFSYINLRTVTFIPFLKISIYSLKVSYIYTMHLVLKHA